MWGLGWILGEGLIWLRVKACGAGNGFCIGRSQFGSGSWRVEPGMGFWMGPISLSIKACGAWDASPRGKHLEQVEKPSIIISSISKN
jgi:hypothetical protein